MCGIAGLVDMQGLHNDTVDSGKLIRQMTNALIHRGPDGGGTIALDFGRTYLGHRRLSIIDLSSRANQPMQTADGRYTIVYNGEVYNYQVLRQELASLGQKFISQSDTEVVLQAFAQWGVSCLDKFNGIFAFAIWDEGTKTLTLACDRYGTKPVYYAEIGGQFVFASEYKAILLHPLFRRKLNLKAVKEYFTFQNIFSNQTFIEGINILPAGSYMQLSHDGVVQTSKYWDFRFGLVECGGTQEENIEELRRIFIKAVQSQLVSDVPVGAYLSGGMDSGSIVAVASQRINTLQTFTCGMDVHSASGLELYCDEREQSEYMSYCFNTSHYEMVLKAGDMEKSMHNLVYHVEDPRVGQTTPNYYVARLAAHFVKVVLAGTGGDEIFGGYPWRYYRVDNCGNFEDYINKYYDYWQRILHDAELAQVMAPVYREIEDYSTRDVFKNVFSAEEKANVHRMRKDDYINYSLNFEARTFLRGLLIVEDKLSMAFGLETRVPFLDNELVDFAHRVPIRQKLRGNSHKYHLDENEVGRKSDKFYLETNDGKLILRQSMSKLLPERIVSAKKQGFSVPSASWFRGDSIDYVKGIITNRHSRIYEVLDQKSVEKLFSEHVEGKVNRRLFIWSILNFEEYLRTFF